MLLSKCAISVNIPGQRCKCSLANFQGKTGKGKSPVYGAQNQGGAVVMQGPLDENDINSSTNTSDQAWNELWTDLNNNPATVQNMTYSAQIHKGPTT